MIYRLLTSSSNKNVAVFAQKKLAMFKVSKPLNGRLSLKETQFQSQQRLKEINMPLNLQCRIKAMRVAYGLLIFGKIVLPFALY